jgi:diguanylate cyclase
MIAMNDSAPSPQNDSHYSRMALSLMDKHGIAPNPENYAVWFHYAVGKNRDLIQDIDAIVKNNVPFKADTCSYLYNKYVIANRNQKMVDDAALNAQKVLTEVMRAINDFSGETKNYNECVDQYLERFDKDFGDDNIRAVFKEMLEATVDLKRNGERMNQKLEESTAEISSLRKNLQQVTIEAQRDALTGLFNRKTFDKLFDEQQAMAKEKSSAMSLLMLDIDHFKQFNDKFGHLLGDEVLKIVARALTDTLKGRDIVARFGGEEFVVLLPETPMEGAMKVAELVRGAIASKELKRKDTGENYGVITVSIGASAFRHASDTLPSLIKRADDALYQAKRQGRNRVAKEA